MKRLLLAIACPCLALVLPSCLQSETTLRLNKDGSGTLVEQTTYGAQMLAMFAQMAAGGGGVVDPLADLCSLEKAKTRATTLGERVTVEKCAPYESGGNKGASTTYHFSDITKLKISPGDGFKNLSPQAAGAPAAAPSQPLTFAYTGGKLTVTLPEPKMPAAGAPQLPDDPNMPDMENPQMQVMMKQMLADMKMSFKLVIEPGIAETDAAIREGNTITLMELQMAKLLEKPDTLKKLSKFPKEDTTAAFEFIKNIEGTKMETKKQITVQVK